MLLFLFLPSKEVFNPAEEALSFFFLTGCFKIFLLDLLILLQRRTVGKNLHSHELSLAYISKQKGDAPFWVFEHVESIGECAVALLEAVVDLHLKRKGKRF